MIGDVVEWVLGVTQVSMLLALIGGYGSAKVERTLAAFVRHVFIGWAPFIGGISLVSYAVHWTWGWTGWPAAIATVVLFFAIVYALGEALCWHDEWKATRRRDSTPDLGPEARQALDAMVGREAERLEREVQRLLTGDDVRVSVVANAIGFSIFAADGRPVTVNAQGVEQVDVTDDEAERCRAAAVAVLAHLEAYGYG